MKMSHLLSAVVLGVAVAAAPAVSASAASIPTSASVIHEHGSITITTLTNAPTTTTPVSGVDFELVEITGVDTTTAVGQDLVDRYRHDPSLALGHLGQSRSLSRTDASGQTGIDGLPLGAYLLRQVGGSTYAPMVLALPTVDNSTGARVMAYDLSVFPKPAPITPIPTPTPTSTPSPTSSPTASMPSSTSSPGASTSSPSSDDSSVTTSPVPVGASGGDSGSSGDGRSAGRSSHRVEGRSGAQTGEGMTGRQLGIAAVGVAALLMVWIAVRRRQREQDR